MLEVEVYNKGDYIVREGTSGRKCKCTKYNCTVNTVWLYNSGTTFSDSLEWTIVLYKLRTARVTFLREKNNFVQEYSK